MMEWRSEIGMTEDRSDDQLILSSTTQDSLRNGEASHPLQRGYKWCRGCASYQQLYIDHSTGGEERNTWWSGVASEPLLRVKRGLSPESHLVAMPFTVADHRPPRYYIGSFLLTNNWAILMPLAKKHSRLLPRNTIPWYAGCLLLICLYRLTSLGIPSARSQANNVGIDDVGISIALFRRSALLTPASSRRLGVSG